MQTFRYVEHEVPAIASRQSFHQRSNTADAVSLMTEFMQGGLNAFDGVDAIEFRSCLFTVTGVEVILS
jgi:hypothetical protein